MRWLELESLDLEGKRRTAHKVEQTTEEEDIDWLETGIDN